MLGGRISRSRRESLTHFWPVLLETKLATEHQRPSHLVTSTLGAVEHTASKDLTSSRALQGEESSGVVGVPRRKRSFFLPS